jgi:hypothetical protein
LIQNTNISNTNANNIKTGLDYYANKKSTFGFVVNAGTIILAILTP